MTLLIPLGLLALLSLLVLLLIYLIRPNYQQQYISSTYIWKLSLKYRRRRIPTSRIRNILIIICQVLILVACAFILAEPAVSIRDEVTQTELIIVLDSSASMRTENDEGTRMERAVALAEDDAYDILDEGGYVSIIRAAGDCEILVARASGPDGEAEIGDAFESVLEDSCTYGTSDINAAIELCETEILSINPDAEIRIYTDLDYSYLDYLDDNGVKIVNVADSDNEWNVAILDAYTEKIDGYYVLYADMESYGRRVSADVEITFRNVTYRADPEDVYSETTDEEFTVNARVECDGEGVTTLMVLNEKTYLGVFADVLDEKSGRYQVVSSNLYTFYYYDEIEIRILTDDSYDLDDIYYVYGGRPADIEVLYVSTETNLMTSLVVSAMRSGSDSYSVNVTTYTGMTRDKLDGDDSQTYTSGYDLYLYEHVAPATLPTDGVVFLFDPDIAPEGSGFTMEEIGHEDTGVNRECYLSATEYAEGCGLVKGIDASNIFLTKSSIIYDYEAAGYVPLMTFECDYGLCPALLLKNSGDTKVVVMTFSVHYSNIAVRPEFSMLFVNLISYFFPATVSGTDYTVGDVASVNSMGPGLTVWFTEYGSETPVTIMEVSEEDGVLVYTDADGEITEYYLPIDYEFTEPGRYRLRVTTYFPASQRDTRDVVVFVHADASESDIFAVGGAITVPYRAKSVSDYYDDLLLWFAIVLVAIAFIEWILHMMEGM